MGYCRHWIPNFPGLAAPSSELMKADTPEPPHDTDTPESGFYNLRDSPVIVSLSFSSHTETSFQIQT